jgi:uncharacterized protein (TIGR03032 family)
MSPPIDLQFRLRSTYSHSLLTSGRVSVLITTYQAGQLIIVRQDGQELNTHFYALPKPMGMAANQTCLAIGAGKEILEFYNMPAVAQKLSPIRQYDACYLPRNTHITGDIDIHEMAWAEDTLWFINTRFSCLCTLDKAHSFTPRWQPPFVSTLAPEDRCHLNGLGMVNGSPQYVTALGHTNAPQGWRQHRANGGILMDITTNEIIAQGLSMPHSPRWYRNQLWVLESGQGSLARVDLQTGQLETVARLPGFTRGLTFGGPLAFVGLSQVREGATFSGLPLTEQLTDRACGVWVINIETGQTVAYLRFDGDVREIFAVELLAQTQCPEILPPDHELLSTSYALSEESLKQFTGGSEYY